MRIAFIGDIVGRPAREVIKKNLNRLQKEYSIDYTIANYENASHWYCGEHYFYHGMLPKASIYFPYDTHYAPIVILSTNY